MIKRFLMLFTVVTMMLSAQGKNVAVLDFTAKEVSAAEASMIADFFRSDLVSTKTFTVLDRANMQSVMNEQAFQNSGCTSSECAVQLGRLLNMQYMFIGTLSKFGDNYVLSIDMINVETGVIKDSAKDYSTDINQMLQVTGKLAKRFATVVGGSQVAPIVSSTKSIDSHQKTSRKGRGALIIGAVMTGGMSIAAFTVASIDADKHARATSYEDATMYYDSMKLNSVLGISIGGLSATLFTTYLIMKISSKKSLDSIASLNSLAFVSPRVDGFQLGYITKF